MPTGAAIPPVLLGLVKKIKSGVFVDMGDLVPHHLGLEEITRSKQKCRAISSISEWVQASLCSICGYHFQEATRSCPRPDGIPSSYAGSQQ